MMQEQLDELSIFSLRELARRTGVSSPTSKKKQQLIDDIIAINNGIKRPYIPKTKQGRPPKTFGYNVDSIFNSGVQMPELSKTASLNQETEGFEYVSAFEVSGVVEVASNNVGFLWVNKLQDYDCYFIPDSIISGYHLHNGDLVYATISCANSNVIVKNILKINNIDYNCVEENNRNYYAVDHVPSKNKIVFNGKEFNNLNMNKGENTFVYGSNNNVNTEYSIKLLNACDIDEKLYINVSIAEKNKHVLKDIQNAELFVSKITDSIEITKRIVNLAIERAIRLFEEGKNVVIVVDDALSVASVDNQDLAILRRLISLTKNSNNGSISIVAIMDENKQINQIEKLADHRIKI